MGRFHVVLLFLGCESDYRIGMFSQNPVFVLIILDMTNGEEIALGKSQGRQNEGRKQRVPWDGQTEIGANSHRMVAGEDSWASREMESRGQLLLTAFYLKPTPVWVSISSFWDEI